MRVAQAGGSDDVPLETPPCPDAPAFDAASPAARRPGLTMLEAAAATEALPRAAPATIPPAAPAANPAPATPAATIPPAAAPVPTTAPAPSCGPPDTMPLAIPGPKMPSPNRESAASTMDVASSMVG